MQQIAEWLERFGLSEYAQRFAENDIDFTILSDLTDQDLEKIGIASLGHRRKLLRAIATLKNIEKGTSAMAVGSSAAPLTLDSAERRQVTVMFSDLVDSTALSARMDPEDLRELISAYQKCVAETVHQFDGFVARYMGDGVLAYFGYPQAHEDDAERAVRAGLELSGALARLNTRTSLHTRIGIATGLVVVGDLIGSGDTQERSMVGTTPNIAARLQGTAESDMVVICDSTRRIIGNLFELEDLGPRNLKGIAGPVQARAVLRPSSVASRFEALHATGMTALVGRKEESELLLRCWSKATNGEGQVVLLSGEAGIGKSRLSAAIMELLADKPHTRLRYFCSPQHTNSALHPIIGQMERAAGLARDDSVQAKLDKLDALLQQSSTSAEDAALIAEMLSLPNDGRYPVLELAPQHRRERMLDALIRQMEALSNSAPVLMAFEDTHWADPTSLELLGRTVSKITGHRVLLIVSFRPEFEPSWIGPTQATVLTLNRLTPDQVDAMIDQIIGNKSLPPNIRRDIVERTDGIPLFVEEMTKAVLEAECEGEARRTVAMVPSPALAVPATLHASLMARLDRLGSAKELAQIGAAIGRQLSHVLLAAVARKPDARLAAELDALIRAGLLFRQGAPPDATYLFKHALVQDAAYNMLLREPRRELHARIAETLESRFSEIAENKPEILARHCSEAGQIEKAAALWGKAGLRSAQRSALVEATEQLRRALGLIATLPGNPARRREEIKLQVALITPLLHVSGYAAPETRVAVERARLLIEQAKALGEPPEDPLLLFSVLYGFWVANLVAFNGDVMRELAAQFLTLAEKESATGPLMMGHRLMGLSLLHTGDIADGRTHLDRAIELYAPVEHRPLATRFGQDIGAATLCWRSLTFWLLGYPEAALAETGHALKVGREIGHSATLMYVLNFSTWTYIHCGNYEAANALIDEFIVLKDQAASLFWGAWGMMQRGCLSALTGKASDAVQTISSGVQAMRSTGTSMWMPVWLSYLARTNTELSEFDEGRRCIGEAMTAMEATNETWYEAEVNRIAGEIALLSPGRDAAQAETYFSRALAVARKQQAKSWELRAAMSLARLWRDQGKRQQARDVLSPIQGWFTEGLGTRDLKEAKVLLDRLAV
jgi:class 3 adenylate cyclase/predicted ATPase